MNYQLIGVIFAGVGVVATVLFFVLGFRALRLLEDIRARKVEDNRDREGNSR
jgi:hypothetical protein